MDRRPLTFFERRTMPLHGRYAATRLRRMDLLRPAPGWQSSQSRHSRHNWRRRRAGFGDAECMMEA